MGNFQEVEGGTPIPFFLFRLGQTGTDHLAYLEKGHFLNFNNVFYRVPTSFTTFTFE